MNSPLPPHDGVGRQAPGIRELARAESAFTLCANTRSATEALQLAKLLHLIPREKRGQALAPLVAGAGPECVPYLEPYANDPDSLVRFFAIRALVHAGELHHADRIVDDLLTSPPRFTTYHADSGSTCVLSEDRQLSLALALQQYPPNEAWRIASLLADTATTVAIVKPLRLLEQPVSAVRMRNPSARDWRAYHEHLKALTGANPTGLTPQALRECSTSWERHRQGQKTAVAAWKAWFSQTGGEHGAATRHGSRTARSTSVCELFLRPA